VAQINSYVQSQTSSNITPKLATKQPVGDYATNSALNTKRDAGYLNYSSHDHTTPVITSNMSGNTSWWQSVKSTLKTYFDGFYHGLTITWSELTGKPTTVAASGITDAKTTTAFSLYSAHRRAENIVNRFANFSTNHATGGGSGTITGVTVTSPLTGGGSSGSVAIGLGSILLKNMTSAANPVYAKPLVRDVRNYGAKCDVFVGYSAKITSGANSLTVPNATYSSADIGKSVVVMNAGAGGGANLVTTITGGSGTTFTLAANAGTSVHNIRAIYGTDDATAFNASFADYTATGNFDYKGMIIALPTNSACYLGSSVVINGPSNLAWDFNGSTVYFDDIIAFDYRSYAPAYTESKPVTFRNGITDGMQNRYVAGATAPTYSTAFKLAAADGSNNAGNTTVHNMKIRNVGTGINSYAYQGKYYNNLIFTADVPSSIGVWIHRSDEEVFDSIIYGFQTNVLAASGGATVHDNHIWVGFGHNDANGSPNQYDLVANASSLRVHHNIFDNAGIAKVWFQYLSTVYLDNNFFQDLGSTTDGSGLGRHSSSDIIFNSGTFKDFNLINNHFYCTTTTPNPSYTQGVVPPASYDISCLNMFNNTYLNIPISPWEGTGQMIYGGTY
jgi:hypothetical protein